MGLQRHSCFPGLADETLHSQSSSTNLFVLTSLTSLNEAASVKTHVYLLEVCLAAAEDEDEEVCPSGPHQKGHTAEVRKDSQVGGFSVTESGSIGIPSW